MNTEQLRAEFEAAMDGLRFDTSDDCTYTSSVTRVAWEAYQSGRAALQLQPDDGGKEAAIAWEVCASLHRKYCKGKDPFFKTRQSDFVKHAEDARTRALETEALQSQDREVVVPYRIVVDAALKILGAEQYERFMGEIDHARRVEGE